MVKISRKRIIYSELFSEEDTVSSKVLRVRFVCVVLRDALCAPRATFLRKVSLSSSYYTTRDNSPCEKRNDGPYVRSPVTRRYNLHQSTRRKAYYRSPHIYNKSQLLLSAI